LDSIWNLPDNSIPNWTGYTADVTVNNVVGPGTGDSLDFFLFSGLTPNTPFLATLPVAEFDGVLGHYSSANVLLATSTLVEGVPTVAGVADNLGRAKIGVTGLGDSAFVGAHVEVGAYTLQIVEVPEPAGAILAACGAGLAGLYWIGRRKRAAAKRDRA
jgi:hypothetical protein